MAHFGWTTPWQQLAFSVHQQTRSWDGGIKSNLGGAIVIRDESGFGMDRDVNGARGEIYPAVAHCRPYAGPADGFTARRWDSQHL